MVAAFIDVIQDRPEFQEPSGPTGLNLAQAPIFQDPFKFGQQVENAAIGREFAKLLDAGKEGMIQTVNALIEEGSLAEEDLRGLDPNLPQFQSENGQVTWYEAIEQKLKKNVATKTRQELTSLEGEELVDEAFREGVDISALRKGRKDVKREANIQAFFDARKEGAEDGRDPFDVDPGETNSVQIQRAIDSIDEDLAEIAASGIADEPAIKAEIARLKIKRSGLEKRIKNIQAEGRFQQKETRVASEAEQKAVEKFLKDTKDVRALDTQLNDVDTMLKEVFGLPEGLESQEINIDLAGAGFFGTKFKRFAKGDKARFSQLIERIFAEDRHRLFGAALTGVEAPKFDALRGGQILGNEQLMVEALRLMKRDTSERMKGTKRQVKGIEDIQTPAPAKVAPVITETDDEIIEERIIGGVKVKIRKKK